MFFFIPVAKSPAIIAGLSFLGIWVFSGTFIKKRSILFKQKHLWPVAALVVLTWMGLLHADNIDYELGFAKDTYYWLYPFAIASIPFAAFRSENFIKAFLGGLLFTAVLATLQYAGMAPMRAHSAPMGLLGGLSHGILSLFLVFGLLALSCYFRKVDSKKHRILILSLMAVYIIALFVVVYGRTGYLAFMVLSPLMVYNLVGKKQILKIIAVSALALVLLFISPTVRNRIKSVAGDMTQYSEGHYSSTGARFEMWKICIKLFLKNPVTGSGASGFMTEWKKNKPYPEGENYTNPHNTFFFVASGFGIPGIAVLIWLYVVLYKSGWNNRDNIMGFSIFAFSLVLFIGSLTNTMIADSTSFIWVSTFTGLQGALNEK